MRPLLIFFTLLPTLILSQNLPQSPLLPPDVMTTVNNKLVVMNVAAHPDDEDGQTLTYYRHAKNAIAYSVIYTRGEGGQNEIGAELYEALGALRTVETEKAARILGTKVFNLNYNDFGFSKHAKEAFARWGGRDAVTAKIVYMIRKLKPDVIFTNHDTLTVGASRQHGQHQAVGISIYDAFSLANDAKYHPEQLREAGVSLWQPKRLFLRRSNAAGSEQVQVPVGDMFTPKNKSFQAIAMDALKEHASQGMDVFVNMRTRPPYTTFVLLRSATNAPLDATDLAANLPLSTKKISANTMIDAGFVAALPENTFQLDDKIAVAGQRVKIQTSLRFGSFSIYYEGRVIRLQPESDGFSFLVPTNIKPTIPLVSAQYNRITNNPLFVYQRFEKQGTQTIISQQGYLPLEIAPSLYMEPISEMIRLKKGMNVFELRIQAFEKRAKTQQLAIAIKQGSRTISTAFMNVGLQPEALNRVNVAFEFKDALPNGDYQLVVSANNKTLLSQPARAMDANAAPNLHVGIVKSYDNTLEQVMQELGVQYKMLDSLALASGKFDGLNTIVIDIRAYFTRQDLRTHNDKLLEWVKNGGHLVVNYQKLFEWNEGATDPTNPSKKNPNFAPFPLKLSSKRVTEEDANVTLLKPELGIFKASPNPYSTENWKNWVQERGLYFPDQYDTQYQELFAINDKGENPLKGSTLLANYGKGTYLYTALVWYRQLKVYHQGAYQLFANMLSMPMYK